MVIYSIKYPMRPKNLVGQLLVANPLNPKDGLEHSVVLMVSCSSNVVLGLQVNFPTKNVDLSSIFTQLGLWYDGPDPVYYGGDISPNKIHVVHSSDWRGLTTVQITEDIYVTNDISVLTAIGSGEGPEHFRACAGYCAWDKSLLEYQLNNKTLSEHRWEVAPATAATVFTDNNLNQWHNAIEASARSQVNKWFNPVRG